MFRSQFRFLLILIFSCSRFASAQNKPVDAEGHQWWQHAVFYEIYPRSFADSNNDGVGDLNGITSKMDYLHELGVDAIWITPCYPSPQVDFGYDVSNYEDIDPMYGTLADFDRMVAEGRKHRGSHHHGFCAEPYFRPAPVVSGFEVFAERATSRLVYLARRQRARSSLPITGFRFLADRHGSSIRIRTSTTTTFFMRLNLT